MTVQLPDAHLAAAPKYGADLDAKTPKDWTPLSYAKAKGKYGVTHEKGIYPEDVLKVSHTEESALASVAMLRLSDARATPPSTTALRCTAAGRRAWATEGARAL